MTIINAYIGESSANIRQTRIKRDWMDNTSNSHAYHCFPLSLANGIGYELSLPEDITFIWDGKISSSGNNVKILKGEKWCHPHRGNASLSIRTGIIIKTDELTSMLHMPVPNLFNENYIAFTSIVSTSFFDVEFPASLKIMKPNVEITIPANYPFATLVPISLTNLMTYEMEIHKMDLPESFYRYHDRKNKVAERINKAGKWTDWYRDAIDHTGKSIGKHETKAIKMKITDKRDSGNK
jgi:hypothetical protein